MLKGMSAVIAVVLILLITISLAAAGYLFFGSIMSSTTESASQSISQITTAITQDFNIESVRGEKIYIRNTGQGTLSGFSVYVDDRFVNASDISIPPGEVRNITLYDFIDYSRPRTLKVTTAGTMKTMTVGPDNQYPDLVLYLKLDEGSGTTTADSSQNNFVGGLYKDPGADYPQWVEGKYGKALRFSGNSWAGIPQDPIFDMQNKDLTLSAWVNVSGDVNHTIAGAVYCHRYTYGIMLNDTEKFVIQLTNNDTNNTAWKYPTNNPLQKGQWYFLAFSLNHTSKTITAFINNISYPQINVAGALPLANYTQMCNPAIKNWYFALGRHGAPPLYFIGTIDDVRLWRRALTPEEILNQYMHGPI